ncbi:hypothetical protein EST38_g2735 [Candolleomyces aberdarensis]|uniref:DnaJ homologue subfamily C member 28 conserved domain-containing protein n=1 Tax=Candolleomyces aberdarensis TaxID=2316362 RepID=A0A4V1Q4S5_9AGAR|nr:hypothetical protein EST38_g2735 [Candolleomyces aberdarensis]
MSNVQRRHTEHLQFQHPNWTGDESTEDAVLRMLVDKYKPLGTGKIQTAEEKLRKGAAKPTSVLEQQAEAEAGAAVVEPENTLKADSLQATLEARLGATKVSVDGTSGYTIQTPHPPRAPPKLVPSETGSWASEPLIPSSADHRPWHTTFKVPDHATLVPSVKSAAPLVSTKSKSGAGVSGQDPADPKAKMKERENMKKNVTAGRLGQAREAMLDYRLGLKGGGSEGETVGSGRAANPQSMKGWMSLVEDRIEKARKAGAFATVNGRGQPLVRSTDEHNPFIAREEYLMNRIVQRNGAAPPWVELQTELEDAVNAFRGVLEDSWVRTASRSISSSLYPPSTGKLSLPSLDWVEKYRDRAWEEKELGYHTAAVEELNSVVRKYNGMAPYPVRRPPYSVNVERERVYKECAEKILEALRQRGKEGRLGGSETASGGGGGGGGSGGSGGRAGEAESPVVKKKGKKGWVLKEMVFAAVDWVMHLGPPPTFKNLGPSIFCRIPLPLPSRPSSPQVIAIMSDYEYIAAGDVVAVRHGAKGNVEGLVVGSHVDYAGRQVIEVQLDGLPEVYHAWYPTVTRVRRTVYTRPTYLPARTKTIERRIYW